MVREPELTEAQWMEVYAALLGRAHDFAICAHPEPLEELSRLSTGTALTEVADAIFGLAEPLVLPDLSFIDHPKDARYATESDRLWDTGPRV